MRLLFDTNVILDVLLAREPWLVDAQRLWQAKDDGRIVGYLTASTLTDVFYVARRLKGVTAAWAAVATCLEAFEICIVDRAALEQAHGLPGKDFEDNLQIACAQFAGLDGIVTRNVTDFEESPIAVWTPAEVLAQLG